MASRAIRGKAGAIQPSAQGFSNMSNGSHSTNGRQREPMRKSAASRLMGDIPFGVNYYSADVYSRRDEFALDWSGGAPPEPYFKDDEFTQKWGQNWGIPLYRWDVMRTRNLAWWRQRVRGVRKIFHVFRIDHVLGFYRIYAFPWRPERNAEFLPLSWDEMRERTGGAIRSSIRATIPLGKTARRTAAKARNICAWCWRKSGATRVVGRRSRDGAGLCPAELAFVRHSGFQDSAMGNHAGWPIDPGRRV